MLRRVISYTPPPFKCPPMQIGNSSFEYNHSCFSCSIGCIFSHPSPCLSWRIPHFAPSNVHLCKEGIPVLKIITHVFHVQLFQMLLKGLILFICLFTSTWASNQYQDDYDDSVLQQADFQRVINIFKIIFESRL